MIVMLDVEMEGRGCIRSMEAYQGAAEWLERVKRQVGCVA